MSFRYDFVQPHVLDTLKKLFEKSTLEWTDEETDVAWLSIEALRIAINQRTRVTK